MAKTLKKPKYDALTFAYSKKEAGKMIPNTTFTAGGEDERFYSIKNKTVLPSTGKVASILSDKIAKAILESQLTNDDTMIGWGKNGTEQFIYGELPGGSASDIEKFIINLDEKKIYATNIYSHLLYKVILAYDLLQFVLAGEKATDEQREAYEILAGINYLPTEPFDETSILVDSAEKESFVTLCDSILQTASMFNGYEFDTEIPNNDKDFDIYANKIKYNLLPLVAMHNKVDDMSIDTGEEDEDGNPIYIPEIKPLKVKRKKKGAKSKANSSIPYKDRDYTLMTDEEAEDLPEELKIQRDACIELYERNKEFMDDNDELWECILSFYHGNIWKMGFFGPSASGKTTFVRMMAGALKLPFALVTGDRDTETAQLFGHMTIRDGDMVFVDGPLTQIARYGGIFLFDERNMVNAGVVSATNNLLDDTRMCTIPQTGETIRAHKNFRYCEAFNIGYEGTKEDNLSHISRIDEFHKLAHTDETEAKIVVANSGIELGVAKTMIQVKNNITKEIIEDGDETTQRVDLRSCISWAKKTMDLEGNALRAALSTILTPLSKEVDTVLSSNNIKNFSATGDPVVDYASNEIRKYFDESVKKKVIKKEYEFEKYEL